MIPSSAEFEYFLEVARSLNLSRASERLGISQPSLSLAIKRLEASVGTELLIRHQHGVALTQGGKQLLAHINQLVKYWQNTKSLTLASHQKVQGSYILGCHSTVANDLLAEVMPGLFASYPGLELHLQHDVSRRILEQLIMFNIDIAIVINPIKHPDLIITKLGTDEMGFWQSIHNKQNQDVILCDPSLLQTKVLIQKARKMDMAIGRVININSLEVIAKLTAHGSGVGILPKHMAGSIQPGLEPLQPSPIFAEEIYLVYRHENRHIAAIKTIVTAIKDYAHNNF